MDVSIRQATIEDKERIGRFLALAYKEIYPYNRFPARWSWEFEKNPFWNGSDLPVWLAELNGEIIGQTCEMIVPLWVRDKAVQAAWGVDLIVLPEYRRLGVARRLMIAATEHLDWYMALSMNNISRQVLLSLRLTEANSVHQLYKRIRLENESAYILLKSKFSPNSIFPRIFKKAGLPSVMGAVYNSWRQIQALKRSLTKRASIYSIEKVNRFGKESDELWSQLAPHYPMIVKRDSSYLNWKYVEQPEMSYENYFAMKQGRALGTVVIRRCKPPDPKVGIIADVIALPNDSPTMKTLIDHAVERLSALGVVAIVAASNTPNLVRHYLDAGFVIKNKIVPLFRFKEIPQAGLEFIAKNWALSLGDHDWDQYPSFWL